MWDELILATQLEYVKSILSKHETVFLFDVGIAQVSSVCSGMILVFEEEKPGFLRRIFIV